MLGQEVVLYEDEDENRRVALFTFIVQIRWPMLASTITYSTHIARDMHVQYCTVQAQLHVWASKPLWCRALARPSRNLQATRSPKDFLTTSRQPPPPLLIPSSYPPLTTSSFLHSTRHRQSCRCQYRTPPTAGSSSPATRSMSPHPTKLRNGLYSMLTALQLRCRRWRRYSQHRGLPHHFANRRDFPGSIWPQQDRHQPLAENDPDIGCRNYPSRTGGCAPCREARGYGKSAAGGGDGRRDEPGDCAGRRVVEESRGVDKDGSQDERYRGRI